MSLPENLYTSYEEIENVNNNLRWGSFLRAEMKDGDILTGSDKETTSEVVFKLFGFIPIRKIKVKMLPEEDVYIGGQQIGLTVNADGVIVASDSIVDSSGLKIEKNKILKNGDIIQQINNKKISNINELKTQINDVLSDNENEVELDVLRKGQISKLTYPIVKDIEGNCKLGFWARDNYSGVGTLSFVLSKNNRFGALGHSICEENSGQIIPINDGQIYSCNLVNIEKGKLNKPGQLNCVFLEKDVMGDIEQNTKVGVFGELHSAEGLIDVNKKAKLGGRLSVKMGKAVIVSEVSGISQDYEIEIIKINNQSSCDDKSFVFRVVDKNLIALTGGIVQGMSGSPIMQNGKIVGAVTHVFVSDSCLGYGVYTDWMLEKVTC